VNIRTYTTAAGIYVDLWNGSSQLITNNISVPAASVEISHSVPLFYVLTLGSTTTIKLRASRSGGTSAIVAVAGQITAVKIA